MDRGHAITAELLLAATKNAAVIVRRVTAFVDRLEFWLVIRLAERAGGIEDARLRVRLPDGREQLMRELIGAPTAEYYDSEFTISEPVDGDVTFILDWPSRGIANARTTLCVTSS